MASGWFSKLASLLQEDGTRVTLGGAEPWAVTTGMLDNIKCSDATEGVHSSILPLQQHFIINDMRSSGGTS